MKFVEFINGAIAPAKVKKFTDMEMAIMEGGGSLDVKEPSPSIKRPSALRQAVEEAEIDTEYTKELEKEFTKLGYKQINSGADSTIWAKDKTYVIKILMPEDETSIAGEVFRKFYEFCDQHKHIKCLPVINEYNTIDVLDKEYIQIDMERLLPLKRNSFEEGIVWFFSDFAVAQHSWNEVDRAMGLQSTWIDYNKRLSNKLADYWQNISMSNSQEFQDLKSLYNVMGILYKTGQINKFGWDLHTENVMKRANGDLVIIDPWFAMSAM